MAELGLVLAVGLVVIAIPALIVFLSVKLTVPRIGLIKGFAMFVGLTLLFNLLLLPAWIGWIPAASLPTPVVEDTIKGG